MIDKGNVERNWVNRAACLSCSGLFCYDLTHASSCSVSLEEEAENQAPLFPLDEKTTNIMKNQRLETAFRVPLHYSLYVCVFVCMCVCM